LRVAVRRRTQGSAQLNRRIEELLGVLLVLPLPIEVDRHYATMRAELDRRGQPIGPNDLLIAAHALALDATLVTDNVREFSRVEGLAVENWLRD
jgi:tRNA(fMet)-specific endonuclease VapC